MSEGSGGWRLLPVIWAAGWLVLILLSLWPEGTWMDRAIGTAWWNVGHVPVYAVMTMLTLLMAVRRYAMTPWRLFGLAVAMAGLGALIETLQPYFGRTADVEDEIHNLMGILLALGIFYLGSWLRGAHRRAG